MMHFSPVRRRLHTYLLIVAVLQSSDTVDLSSFYARHDSDLSSPVGRHAEFTESDDSNRSNSDHRVTTQEKTAMVKFSHEQSTSEDSESNLNIDVSPFSETRNETILPIPLSECTNGRPFNFQGDVGTAFLTQLQPNMTLDYAIANCKLIINASEGQFTQIQFLDFECETIVVSVFRKFDKHKPPVFSQTGCTIGTHQTLSSVGTMILYITFREQFTLRQKRPLLRVSMVRKPIFMLDKLDIVFTSQSSGYVTFAGYNGVAMYDAALNASAEIHVPKGNAVLLNFLHFDVNNIFKDCQRDQISVKDYVSISALDNVTAAPFLLLCGPQLVPTQVYNTSLVVRLQAGGLWPTNTGFKMLFEFLPFSVMPQKLESGLFNCSVPHYASFKHHLWCNLQPECEGGEDEQDCPFTSPPCNGSVGNDNTCFQYVSWKKKLSWSEANLQCNKRGGRLASFGNAVKLQTFLKIFQYGKKRLPVYVGVGTTEDYSLPLLYRNVWQWRDKTMAFQTNISYALASMNTQDRACSCYAPSYPHMIWGIDCKQARLTDFICEVTHRAPTLDNVRLRQNFISVSASKVNISANVVSCPLGHMTYDFLSCDPKSHCGVDTYLSTCSVPKAGAMPTFSCLSGSVTIPFTLVCDFRPDCPDESDEDFCWHQQCHGFSCKKFGQCIRVEQLCDGVQNCVDRSDEFDCVLLRQTHQQIIAPPMGLVEIDGGGNAVVLPFDTGKTCPETHFQCPSGYCMPVFLRCNGVYDCPDKEDELGCKQYTCPNFYRCRESSVCVHPKHMCDGVFQCPRQDDEWLCHGDQTLVCPEGCLCQGLAFVCTKPFIADAHPDLRYLDASGSGITPDNMTVHIYLVQLVLSANNLSTLVRMAFPNLIHLDVSDNMFSSVNMDVFMSLHNLRVLILARNPLTSVFKRLWDQTHRLSTIDLSFTNLDTLSTDVLSSYHELKVLNVSNSKIRTISTEGFKFTPSLVTLDISGNPVNDFPPNLFRGLHHLKSVKSDNNRLCCRGILPESVHARFCTAPPDAISSCEHLIDLDWHRAWLILLSLLSSVGNACCLVFRFLLRDSLTTSPARLLVTNLNVANYLMSVPVTLVATADHIFRGSYATHEAWWKGSMGCGAVRFFMLMSSEVSVALIVLITLDRLLVLRILVCRLCLDRRSAVRACEAAWAIGIVVSSLSLLLAPSRDWRGEAETLSDRHSGLCFPMPLDTPRLQTTGFILAILTVINPILFLFVLAGQAIILWSVRGMVMISDQTQRTKDIVMAHRLVAVVLSDFLCWFPTGVLGLMTLAGSHISDETNMTMALFVLPVNSALNPFLYMFGLHLEREKNKRERHMLKWLESRAPVTQKTDLTTHVTSQASEAAGLTPEKAMKILKSSLNSGALTWNRVVTLLSPYKQN